MSYVVDDKQLLYNPMLLQVLPKSIIPSKEKVRKKLASLAEKFDTRIMAPIFLEALYNVRKNEYYIAPEYYPFDMNEIFKILRISKWQFQSTEFERALESILTSKDKAKLNASRLQKFSDETNLEKNIGQVKLARTLRKVLDKKKLQ